MKVPVFYAYPYAQLQEAEFSIRFEGMWLKFCCKKLIGHKKRIRTAMALLIREKVVAAQGYQYWKLNKRRTYWIFYNLSGFFGKPPALRYYRVVSIPSHEVYWALSGGGRNVADVETYEGRKITRWRIIRTESFCRLCDVPGVSDNWRYICPKCLKKLKTLGPKLSEEDHSELLNPEKFQTVAQQDRSRNLRWLREFVAQGSFTPSEFKALCNQYGNICLRCRKKRVLVADHVISLAQGGKNDITNIQPLCKRCNGIKGAGSEDYRKRQRKR